MSVDVVKVLEEHSKVEGGVRCAASDCGWPYVPTASLPRLIAEHQTAVLASLSVRDTSDMRRMTMVEIRNRDFPDRMDAARQTLLEGHAEARTAAELELLRAGAAAGMEVVDGIYGAGARRTIRLGELLRFSRDFISGEMDELLKFHHEDRITQRRREKARESQSA